jgi:hypothetical protein
MRRWLIERFFAWIQWQRRILVRWEYHTTPTISSALSSWPASSSSSNDFELGSSNRSYGLSRSPSQLSALDSYHQRRWLSASIAILNIGGIDRYRRRRCRPRRGTHCEDPGRSRHRVHCRKWVLFERSLLGFLRSRCDNCGNSRMEAELPSAFFQLLGGVGVPPDFRRRASCWTACRSRNRSNRVPVITNSARCCGRKGKDVVQRIS